MSETNLIEAFLTETFLRPSGSVAPWKPHCSFLNAFDPTSDWRGVLGQTAAEHREETAENDFLVVTRPVWVTPEQLRQAEGALD